jgi:DeoR family ulaG and ulaABCDEF operon transcriptional repressor
MISKGVLRNIMNELQRHDKIINNLQQSQSLSVAEIVELFQVSPATARRDIVKLNDQGRLKKVRNGAEYLPQEKIVWSPLSINNTAHFEEKSKIAKQASNLCEYDSTVVINCGTTAFILGQELCGSSIQIVTNYFPLASYLIENEHENVIIMGGQYNKKQNLFINPSSESASIYSGDLMFTSGKGLTEAGLYKTEMLTAVAEQQMLKQVSKLVVVVDSSKVGQKTGMMFCPASNIHTVITGKDADSTVIKSLREQGVNVILV